MNRTFTWTDELAETAVTLWKEGKSAAKIAVIIGATVEGGITRNTVIGKVMRVLIKRGEHVQKPRRGSRQVPRTGAGKPTPVAPLTGSNPPPRRTTEALPRTRPLQKKFAPVLSLAGAVPPCGILDVTGCRWPVGTDASVPGRHLFCNREKPVSSSYCEAHIPKPGTMSAPFNGDELSLIRAWWNGGQGLEWLAIRLKRCRNVVASQARRMGLGRG